MSDTLSPAYEGPPPPFEEPPASVYTKAGNSNIDNSKSSGGFLSSLASPFKAATAALRTKPEPLVVALCHAATLGNVPQLRSFLNQGTNINGRNENGHTALICAIRAGQLDAIRSLLEAGADHSACDAGRKGKPPLFHAVHAENRAAVDLLFEHGATANQIDDWPAILCASRYGRDSTRMD
jgi:ankyrin repeat protein